MAAERERVLLPPGRGFGAELRWYPRSGISAFAVGNDTTYAYGRLLDEDVAAAAGRAGG